MFDLIFTITDQPPVEDLGIELPIEAVRNLTECQRLLQDAVTAGTFVINVSVGWGCPVSHYFSVCRSLTTVAMCLRT